MDLNIEFLIHGVLASGQAFSKNKDSDYCKQFYATKKADVLLTVDTRRMPHGVCTYYNYLRYNNVSALREGSYFGMTVRIDSAFCKDVGGMYHILDSLFCKKIVGQILDCKDGKYTYKINSFDEVKPKLEKLEKDFLEIVQKFFPSEDYIPLSSVPKTSNQQVCKVYIGEMSAAIAEDCLRKGISLHVSPLFASKQLAAEQKKAATIQANADEKLKAAEKQYQKLKQEKDSEAENYEQKIDDLNQEIKEALEEANREHEILKNLEEIKFPLARLAELFGEPWPKEETTRRSKHEKKRRDFKKITVSPFVKDIIVVLIVIGLLFAIIYVFFKLIF